MLKIANVSVLLILLSGCGMFSKNIVRATEPLPTAHTSGEKESGYTYIPIDPFPVNIKPGANCSGSIPLATNGKTSRVKILDLLPDNAVRMLVERFDMKGDVTYGASKIAAHGESYRVTIDYINADTVAVPFRISKIMYLREPDGVYETGYADLFREPGSQFLPDTETYEVIRITPGMNPAEPGQIDLYIPVYVGVGLRISTNIFVTGAQATISGIGVIGAEAEADRLRGSLVVQTLGVNGKAVTAALPIQSELNRTTAQNAIVAIGSIKSLLYSDETITSPRVVGLYLPLPADTPLVNRLIAELSKTLIDWQYSCPGNTLGS
jgi:hypothetical protein